MHSTEKTWLDRERERKQGQRKRKRIWMAVTCLGNYVAAT